MIVFIGGLFAGVFIGHSLPRGRGAEELEAENRALRDGLRYTRNVMVNTGVMAGVARYITRLLDDEAGA